MGTSVSKYVGKVLHLIRAIHPEHGDFVALRANEAPAWWTHLRPLSENDCNRFHVNLGSDYSFVDTITCPLYEDNRSYLVLELNFSPEAASG